MPPSSFFSGSQYLQLCIEDSVRENATACITVTLAQDRETASNTADRANLFLNFCMRLIFGYKHKHGVADNGLKRSSLMLRSLKRQKIVNN